MKVIHVTDLHLVRPGERLIGLDPATRTSVCFDDIARWHSDADFCVISGDLTQDGDPEAYRWLRDRLADFPLRTVLMLGNHDDRAVFRQVFPDHPCDPAGFVQSRYEAEGSVFLFLDTLKDSSAAGQYCEERCAWLAAELDAAGEKPVNLFLHHPPFDIGVPYVDRIKLLEAEAFADALSHGRTIRHGFFGHVHRIAYVNWRGIPFTCLPSLNHQVPLVPESVGTRYSREPSAYGIVEIGADQITVNVEAFLDRAPLPSP